MSSIGTGLHLRYPPCHTFRNGRRINDVGDSVFSTHSLTPLAKVWQGIHTLQQTRRQQSMLTPYTDPNHEGRCQSLLSRYQHPQYHQPRANCFLPPRA